MTGHFRTAPTRSRGMQLHNPYPQTRYSFRARRAFTLVELAVVAGLTSVLLVLVLAWVGGIAKLAADGSASPAAQREVSLAVARLNGDVTAATGCDWQRRGGPVESLSPSQLNLYLDEDGDGIADLVSWRLSGTDMIRGVRLGTGQCTFSDTEVELAMITDLAAKTSRAFSPVTDGAAVTLGGQVSCSAIPDPCRYSAIQASFTVAPASGGTIVVDRVMALNTSRSAPPGS